MLLPPIFASCYALVTRLRYEDRKAVADHVNRAICSASYGVNKVFALLRSQLQSRSEASVNDLL